MIRAVEKVRERLLKAAKALEAAGIPYAIAGGNAVAAHVSRVDDAAVQNTRDVDILLRRCDLPAAKGALEAVGFSYRHVPGGLEAFVEGEQGSLRDALHIVPAGEKIRPDNLLPAPDVTHSEPADEFQIVSLPALVGMELVSFRDKDRTQLRDLIELGMGRLLVGSTAGCPGGSAARTAGKP